MIFRIYWVIIKIPEKKKHSFGYSVATDSSSFEPIPNGRIKKKITKQKYHSRLALEKLNIPHKELDKNFETTLDKIFDEIF